MGKHLDTYDPNWEKRQQEADRRINEMFRAREANPSPSMQAFAEVKMQEFYKQEEAARLSQFRTLEECKAYFEGELKEEVLRQMGDYAKHGDKDKIRSFDEALRDDFDLDNPRKMFENREMRKDISGNLDFDPRPEEVKNLYKIKGAETMTTAAEIYNQYDAQFETLDEDVKAVIDLVEARGKNNYGNAPKPE